MVLRETIEMREKNTLSKYAALSSSTRGRQRDEEKCDIRTEYQRDRDRIIHSKAFRRLKHKTQVFLAPEGDHYRTRLTHTLEVAQIARTISRALGLNEDLTEAVALAHDLGHTPFGHEGERALNQICPHGFRHNEHSLRVVDVLERKGGLNLTYEVREGIVCHTGGNRASTLEGRVVALADKIAYVSHDIDDAVRGGVITSDDIPKKFSRVLGSRHSQRINTMIVSVIKASDGKPDISMEEDVYCAMMGLREYLFERVYVGSVAKTEEEKAFGVIHSLYDRFFEQPELIPENVRTLSNTRDLHIIIKDYIAGMTDRYAVAKYESLFVPEFWKR